MAVTENLSLEAGELRLDIAPATGGAITGFRKGEFDLMRPTPPEALARGLVRQTSGYPLIPYSNRVAHGKFSYGGESFQLTHNFGDHPHAVHGNAWQRAWTVEERTNRVVVLVLEHVPFGFGPAGWDGWPFRYRAMLRFALSPEGLSLTLSVENTDEKPWPAGLGLHPFFPERPGTQLRLKAEGVWINGPDSLPVSLEPIPEQWDFGTLRPLGEPGLDHLFTGWQGEAEIVYSEHGIRLGIEADPVFRNAVIYAPKGRGFFAVEPVTHMTDAINRMDGEDTGLVVLAPGEVLRGEIRVSVTRPA